MDHSTLSEDILETLTLQEQTVRVFREQFGGFHPPHSLLAQLGIYLMSCGLKYSLRCQDDLFKLTDEQAAVAIKYLPTLQRNFPSRKVVAKLLE